MLTGNLWWMDFPNNYDYVANELSLVCDFEKFQNLLKEKYGLDSKHPSITNDFRGVILRQIQGLFPLHHFRCGLSKRCVAEVAVNKTTFLAYSVEFRSDDSVQIYINLYSTFTSEKGALLFAYVRTLFSPGTETNQSNTITEDIL